MMLKKTGSAALEPALSHDKATSPKLPQDAIFSHDQDFSYNQDDDDIGVETAESTARYIADMIASLALIAREAKLDLLTYLLDMARVEAEMQGRQNETDDD